MYQLHLGLLAAHIILGVSALCLFWWPMLAKKGSANHKRGGRWFFNTMLMVASSGVLLCSQALINPAATYNSTLSGAALADFATAKREMATFLLLLSLFTWQATRVAQWTGAGDLSCMNLKGRGFQLANALLLLNAAWVAKLGVVGAHPLYLAFAVISALFCLKCLRFRFRELSGKARIIEHITASLAAAIAVFTAFFAVGGRHWLQDLLPGMWQLLPWLLPTLLGVIAIRFYQKPLKRHPRGA